MHSAAPTVIRPPLSFVYIFGFNGRDPDKDNSCNHLHVGAAPSAPSTWLLPPLRGCRGCEVCVHGAAFLWEVSARVTSSDEWPLICPCPFSLNATFDQRCINTNGPLPRVAPFNQSVIVTCTELQPPACNCCCYWCIQNEGLRVGLGWNPPQFGFRTHLCVDVCVTLLVFAVHCVLVTVCCILK